MSRWIDADALIESICHTADLGGWIGDTLRNIKRLAVRYINSAPSIDIVRCGECSKRKKNKFCLEHKRYEKDDYGYCSYGERQTERSDE